MEPTVMSPLGRYGNQEDEPDPELAFGSKFGLDTSDTTSHGSNDTTLSDLRYDAPWFRAGNRLHAPDPEPEVTIFEPRCSEEWEAWWDAW